MMKGLCFTSLAEEDTHYLVLEKLFLFSHHYLRQRGETSYSGTKTFFKWDFILCNS
jgi:hypothetical protein